MIRGLFSLGLALIFIALCISGRAVAADSPTVISGGDLPHAVTLAAVDDESFRQRINAPPHLEDEPSLSGAHYSVSSGYWDQAVEKSKGDDSVDAAATYYPEGGFVHATQGSKDVWLVIDLRQQAILNRYIRLVKSNLISDHPGVLEVMAAAAKTESIAVQVGNRPLTDQEAATFWAVSAGMKPLSLTLPTIQPKTPLTAGPNGTWIVFSLPEARSVQMLYTTVSDTLADSLNSEVYGVPRGWLTAVLGPDAPSPGNPGGVSQVAQEKPRGSPVWWLIMIGGGVSCLGIASWWRRRWAA